MKNLLSKRIISLIMCFIMVMPFFSSVNFAQTETELPVMNPDEIIEAEDCVIGANAIIEDDATASGGKTVFINRGYQTKQPDPDAAGDITFKLKVQKPGTYYLKVKCRAKGSGDGDSFWYSLGDGSPYIAVYPKGTTYDWYTYDNNKENDTAYFDVGEHVIRIRRRAQNLRIDCIEVVSETLLEWAAPNQTSGTVEYPTLLDADSIGTISNFKFENGDKVVFIGDSITEGGYYHAQLFNYYATRYPDVEFTYMSKGIGGDKAPGATARIDSDILGYGKTFNKAVIMIGTNDLSFRTYRDDQKKAGFDPINYSNLTEYKTNVLTLINNVKAKITDDILIMTSPMFDEWITAGWETTSPGFNNVIRRGGSILYDIAKTEGVNFVDINTVQTKIQLYNYGKDKNYGTFVPDMIHPDAIGHYMMTYAILKAQGETGEVATVNVDVNASSIDASNATVGNLSINDNTVSYTYKANSLPLGADSTYRQAEKYFPITDELNREIIRVSGLADGVYDIKMDDVLVTSVTADDLAEGVNIADKQNNPGQKQSLEILSISTARQREEHDYRRFVRGAIESSGTISTYQLDNTSPETLISSAQAWIQNNPDNTDGINAVKSFIRNKEREPDNIALFESLERKMYEINTPKQYTVVISPSQNVAETRAKTVWVDFPLPQSAVAIKPLAPKNVSIDRVTFSDENAELTEIPAAGTVVNATGTVTNNTTEQKTAFVWFASYKGDRLVNIKYKSVALAPGKSEKVTLSMTVQQGTDKLTAGVWDSLADINPHTPSAVFPSDEKGIKSIYVNDRLLDGFSTSQDTYTYYVPRIQSSVPVVSVVGENTNTPITITQAKIIGDKATISAGEKTYTINFVADPLPKLDAIVVGGEAIRNFSPDTLAYSYKPWNGYEVVAVAADCFEVNVTQATGIGDSAVIEVISPMGIKKTYTVTITE